MATNSTAPKKTTTSNKSTSSTKKTATKKPTKAEIQAEEMAKKRLQAILIFAIGVFITMLSVISGSKAWLAMHNFLLGLFSWCGFVIGPLFVYTAVKIDADKSSKAAVGKMISVSVLIVLLCGALQIFSNFVPANQLVVNLYEQGIMLKGGGVTAILLGVPLLLNLGFAGSLVTIFILIFVAGMLITGGQLKDVLKTMFIEPVLKMIEAYTSASQERDSRQTYNKPRNTKEIPYKTDADTSSDYTAPPADYMPLSTNYAPTIAGAKAKLIAALGGEVPTAPQAMPQNTYQKAPQNTPIVNNRDKVLFFDEDEEAAPAPMQKAQTETVPVENPATEIQQPVAIDDNIAPWEEKITETPKLENQNTHTFIATAPKVEKQTRKSKNDPPVFEKDPNNEILSIDEIINRAVSGETQVPVPPSISNDSGMLNFHFDENENISTGMEFVQEDLTTGHSENDMEEKTAFSPFELGQSVIVPQPITDIGDTPIIPDDVLVDEQLEKQRQLEREEQERKLKLAAEQAPHPTVSTIQNEQDEQDSSVDENVFPEERPYQFPPISLLQSATVLPKGDTTKELKANADRLVDTLKSFGVQTRITDISRGPAVTRYELQPAAGVKISKIINLADDIALNLAAAGVRIEAPIPNKAAVGIEVPNKIVSSVPIREILDSQDFKNGESTLSVALGRDISGNVTLADLGKMPHMLIAGATGSGKSVCINTLIVSLLYKATPDEVKLLMIDPKVVELGSYNGIPHLISPVVTDPKKAAGALCTMVGEMLRRYKQFADNNVRDLAGFNKLAQTNPDLTPMPRIVIIIDELADLMMASPKDVEDYICRLAQMARAAGMHLVIATQRPSVDVITGVIKANIPSRISFAVSSQIDSRTILDMGGAEKLLGRGDMLFAPIGSNKPTRVQGCFVTDSEVEEVVAFIKESSSANYDNEIMDEIEKNAENVNIKGENKKSNNNQSSGDADDDDDLIMNAIEIVVEGGQASTSMLQRRLKVGYARAARIVDQMEARGIVGPPDGSKPRQILISKEQFYEMKMNLNP